LILLLEAAPSWGWRSAEFVWTSVSELQNNLLQTWGKPLPKCCTQWPPTQCCFKPILQ